MFYIQKKTTDKKLINAFYTQGCLSTITGLSILAFSGVDEDMNAAVGVWSGAYNDSQLLGINDLVVGSNGTFNVTFEEDNCINLFDGCDQNTDFPTNGFSDDAATAMIGFLTGKSVDGNPTNVNGIDASYEGDSYIFIPDRLAPELRKRKIIINTAGGFNDTDQNDFITSFSLAGNATILAEISTFAVFTSVPEPTTGALTLAGAFTGLLHRRTRKKPFSTKLKKYRMSQRKQ